MPTDSYEEGAPSDDANPPSPPPHEPPPSPPWYKRAIPNPLGWLGWIGTLIGIPLAFYFYFVPAQHRELAFLVHRSKTVIVKSGELSSLTVSVGGRPVTTDLTAGVVAIWNTGNQSIRHEHVLVPLVLSTDPPVPIVDVILRKVSRDEIVRPAIDLANRERGQIGVSWSILEPDDAISLQIVYAGSIDTRLIASATLEGQRAIKVRDAEPRDDRYKGKDLFLFWYVVGTIVLMVLGTIYGTGWRRHLWPRPGHEADAEFAQIVLRKLVSAMSAVLVVGVVLTTLGAIWLAQRLWFSSGPPSGF